MSSVKPNPEHVDNVPVAAKSQSASSRKLSSQPLVSTVSPILNGIKYLESGIKSLLAQTYPRMEHIFVDGGSTDGTLEVLARYAQQYPDRIRFLSGSDEGPGDAVNKGLKIAKGDILGWVDPDDWLEPDAIMAVVDFFKQTPDAYFVYGGARIWNEEGTKVLYNYLMKDWDRKEAIEYRFYIIFGAAFYRRELIEKVGYFNPLGNALEYWLRVSDHFEMHRIDMTLLNNRQRHDALMLTKHGRGRRLRLQKYREDYDLCRKYGGGFFCKRRRMYWIVLILEKLGLYQFVSHKLMLKLRSNPAFEKIWVRLRL